ncbi:MULTISPECIES: type IV pilin protein [Acinetobacter]|jgi:type IV pilus assembly protein PilE|uniref:Prepilin-type N-terminal cleavage/methylation domain-containing protein n=1 Tax=Acinetobacter bouvetii TaxID=202951 RepID=A0A4Q7B282_9GAMM|nr:MULTISPECIES: type IV pilin protein [Acinetobacter]RZG69286.1 prepilin-type N-terminal cleavage/methylation domain-containing protein [Acinetobacter bouvetii]TCB75307.1 prepilin-type N-terminal cleavage/methylation domain-containing protein [Acinetobacter sp. ANC 4177]
MNGNKMLPKQLGFSLLELMVALVIVAIFAAIAIPSYQSYARKSVAAQAQQSMKQIATELEKHKSRNFNYLNFVTTPNPVVIPNGATGSAVKYEIVVKDGDNTANALTSSSSTGQSWAIMATSKDEKNNSYVMTSTGVHCYKQGTSIGFDCSGAKSW